MRPVLEGIQSYLITLTLGIIGYLAGYGIVKTIIILLPNKWFSKYDKSSLTYDLSVFIGMVLIGVIVVTGMSGIFHTHDTITNGYSPGRDLISTVTVPLALVTMLLTVYGLFVSVMYHILIPQSKK